MKAGKLIRPMLLLVIFMTASFWPSMSSLLANEACSHECCASTHETMEVSQAEDLTCCSTGTYYLDAHESNEDEQHRCQCYFCLHCHKSFLPLGYSWHLTWKSIFTDNGLPPVVSGIFSAFLFAIWHPPLLD
jgi:hypothetical protein